MSSNVVNDAQRIRQTGKHNLQVKNFPSASQCDDPPWRASTWILQICGTLQLVCYFKVLVVLLKLHCQCLSQHFAFLWKGGLSFNSYWGLHLTQPAPTGGSGNKTQPHVAQKGGNVTSSSRMANHITRDTNSKKHLRIQLELITEVKDE